MKVTIVTERLDSYLKPPVWGDERLARSIAKYMEMTPEVETVTLIDRYGEIPLGTDFCINLQIARTQRAKKTVLWLQNNNPFDFLEMEKMGYDGYLFAAGKHFREAHDLQVSIPFQKEQVYHVDPDEFPVIRATGQNTVVYLGNNIKGKNRNELFLAPAKPYGLRLYGSLWSQSGFDDVWRGPLAGIESTNQLYRNSMAVVSYHTQEHAEWDMPVARQTEALMAGCFVFADRVGEGIFGEQLIYSEGGRDMGDKLHTFFTAKPLTRNEEGRAWAIQNCNIKAQAERIVSFLLTL